MDKDANEKKSLFRRFWWGFKPDRLFAVLLIASLGILVIGGMNAEPNSFVPPPLFPKLAILIGATIFLSALATVSAKFDRRLLDDYMFQMISNGAVIGILTTMLISMIWQIGKNILPPITRDDLMAVMIFSWSLGYFFYRLRGLNR